MLYACYQPRRLSAEKGAWNAIPFFAGGIFEFEFLNFKFLSQDPQYQIETMRRFGGVAGRNWDPPGKATDNENKTRPTSPRPQPGKRNNGQNITSDPHPSRETNA